MNVHGVPNHFSVRSMSFSVNCAFIDNLRSHPTVKLIILQDEMYSESSQGARQPRFWFFSDRG